MQIIKDVDLGTIGSIEMGQSKSIFAPNLPSGVIFFTAIIAHADPGDILSNIAEFMPFGGTITTPESGDVLLQVEVPGGFGSLAIIGSRNADGSDISISEILGDDGSISFQTVNAKQAITLSQVAMGRSNDGIDCEFSREDYQKTLINNQLRLGFTIPVFDRAKEHRGAPTFAKAHFGHPSPSSRQKLNGTDYNLRCPDSPCVHS